MRISDWSSDVCSSDLALDDLPLVSRHAGALRSEHGSRGLLFLWRENGIVGADVASHDLAPPGVAREPHALLLLLAKAKLGDGDKPIDDVIAALHAIIHKLGLILVADHEQRRGLCRAKVRRELDVGFAPVVEHAIGRSEEHTSELQSLMRISYAVFCLKKKIHIKKYQH